MNGLKHQRIKSKLTQDEVAKELKISRRHYQRFENEGYFINMARRRCLAKLLRCSVANISQTEE